MKRFNFRTSLFLIKHVEKKCRKHVCPSMSFLAVYTLSINRINSRGNESEIFFREKKKN